jgi:hypothetical protein
MKSTIENLYNKELAYSFENILDVLLELKSYFKERDFKVENSRSALDYGEIGFYIKSKEGIKSIFIGIWFELWQSTETPFCFAFDWDKRNEDKKYIDSIKMFCDSHIKDEIKFQLYNSYPCILYPKTIFESDNLIPILSEHIMELVKGLNFKF